jgi:hypothetical protein
VGAQSILELGELSRAIGRTWKELWPKVRKLEERKDIGQAISVEQQHDLLDAVEAGKVFDPQDAGSPSAFDGTARG